MINLSVEEVASKMIFQFYGMVKMHCFQENIGIFNVKEKLKMNKITPTSFMFRRECDYDNIVEVYNKNNIQSLRVNIVFNGVQAALDKNWYMNKTDYELVLENDNVFRNKLEQAEIKNEKSTTNKRERFIKAYHVMN